MCRSARRKSPQAEPRTIAQQQGVKLRASVPRRCEIAIQDRGEASQGGDSADLGDVPFHNAPGRQYYAVKDVDRSTGFPWIGSPTRLIPTRCSSATRRGTPEGTVLPGCCARAAPAIASRTTHAHIIEGGRPKQGGRSWEGSIESCRRMLRLQDSSYGRLPGLVRDGAGVKAGPAGVVTSPARQTPA